MWGLPSARAHVGGRSGGGGGYIYIYLLFYIFYSTLNPIQFDPKPSDIVSMKNHVKATFTFWGAVWLLLLLTTPSGAQNTATEIYNFST
jgi:hypothetical protein